MHTTHRHRVKGTIQRTVPCIREGGRRPVPVAALGGTGSAGFTHSLCTSLISPPSSCSITHPVCAPPPPPPLLLMSCATSRCMYHITLTTTASSWDFLVHPVYSCMYVTRTYLVCLVTTHTGFASREGCQSWMPGMHACMQAAFVHLDYEPSGWSPWLL